MKTVERILSLIANLSGYFAGWLVPIMAVLIFAEVFMRYVLNRPLMVADEFGAYLLVALAFFGGAYTWQEKGHVRITILSSRLPPKVAGWLRIVTLFMAFAFAIVLTQSSFLFLMFSSRIPLRSSSIWRTPLQGPHMTLLIGFIILDLVMAGEIARALLDIKALGRSEGKSS